MEWEKLKNRELTPVFQPPKAASKLDVANFDPEFLTMAVDNTPVDQEDIDDIDQKIFKQFSFDEKTAEEEPQQVRRSHIFTDVDFLWFFCGRAAHSAVHIFRPYSFLDGTTAAGPCLVPPWCQ